MNEDITRSITIKGSPDELYRLWSDLERQPLFSDNVKKVTKVDANTSHWVIEGPLGKEIEWTAEITRDDAGKRIAWRSITGDVQNSGQVTFNELPQGETQVTVQMQYVPPVGKLGALTAEIIEDPSKQVEKDLQNFKQYAEQHTAKPNKEDRGVY